VKRIGQRMVDEIEPFCTDGQETRRLWRVIGDEISDDRCGGDEIEGWTPLKPKKLSFWPNWHSFGYSIGKH
jgi:hypothetical protein